MCTHVFFIIQSEVKGELDGLEPCSVPPTAKSPSPDPHPPTGEEEHDRGVGPVETGAEVVFPAKFSFSAPMDNIVVRTHQFSVM